MEIIALYGLQTIHSEAIYFAVFLFCFLSDNRSSVSMEEVPILLLEHAAAVFRIHKRTVCLRTVTMYTRVQ